MKNTILAIAIAFSFTFALPLGAAESNDEVPDRFSYVEDEDNLPAGCTEFMTDVALAEHNDGLGEGEEELDANACHAIATDMNGLDSPKIDVLILVPVSPTAERDMRVMRQSTQMWADGIDWMAADMGLDWLADGIEFHISTQMMEVAGNDRAEFTTYPIVDPEIVIVASNPVGGIGIGVDPIDFQADIYEEIFGERTPDQGPCHGVANPFDHSAWEALPGFDSHHDGRSGTYVEDCDGAGGNVCFSVNAAIDPDTNTIDIFQLYDLVSHETGHCLTLGHVGDGAEGSWAAVPTNDIMAYHSDPPGVSKCVSSLNVEGLVVSMSRYLDTNGDGIVDDADKIYANDVEGIGDDRPFQLQQPDNHYYASPTREAIDCPQPDLGHVPLSETYNFTPEAPVRAFLAIDNRDDGDPVPQGLATLKGQATGATTSADRVILVVPGQDNVTVPIAEDGVWSGNVDLGGIATNETVMVEAIWFQDEDARIDSDRVVLTVDEATPVDLDEVRNAGAGPGSEAQEELDSEGVDTPGFQAFVAVAVLLAAVALVRRRD